MELRHFKMLAEVAECQNLTKAGERLYLSQSALSIQLKQIEAFFNAQLFIRRQKKMILTQEGVIALEAGKKILQEIEATANRINQLTDKDSGEIRISTECYTSYPWLSNILQTFQTQHPKVEIKIITDATRFALANLLDNKIDVGIFEDNKNDQVNYHSLFSDEFFVLVSGKHAWATKKVIEPDMLKEEAYIMYHLPEEESTLYQTFFKQHPPKRLYKMMLTEGILEMVKAGVGFTIQPNWIAYPYIKSGELVPIKLTRKGIKRTWYAGVLKNKMQPAYVNTFVKMLAKNMKQSAPVKHINLMKAVVS